VDPQSLGQHLNQLRKQAKVSLRELARAAEISPASLSAIEKSQSSPTLDTLHKILKALGTNFADFFAANPGSEQSPVFPATETKPITDAHRRYVLLFPKREDLRFGMVHELIAPFETEPTWEAHDFDLGGLVIGGGPARLEIEDRGSWELGKWDAFYVKAGWRHRAINLGSEPLELITVADPPGY